MRGLLSRFVSLLLVAGLLPGGAALAENRSGALTLSPLAGYHVIDGGLDLDNGLSYGLSLGYNASEHYTIEADARFTPTETAGPGPDVDIWTASLGGLYHFSPTSAFNPYLSLGGGLMVYERDTGSDDEDLFGYYGGGVKYALSDAADLRLDVRHLLNYRSDNSFTVDGDEPWRHHLQALAGLTFQFGGTKEAAPPVKQRPVDLVALKSATLDSDHDGILDAVDRCADTEPGVRVDASGCPADTDGDGVHDYLDACRDTPIGTSVDGQGCPAQAEAVASLTLDILFGVNRDQVTPFHYRELDRAAEFIDRYAGRKVVVEGYTDDQGVDAENLALSQRRADNIRKALVARYGVAAERISATGYGEARPVADNATEAGRLQNRRIVITIQP